MKGCTVNIEGVLVKIEGFGKPPKNKKLNDTYSFERDAKGVIIRPIGLNDISIGEPEVVSIPMLSPQNITNDGDNISARYSEKITLKIRLLCNDIYYPRESNKVLTVTPDVSRGLYLHELGHYLDACRIMPNGEKVVNKDISKKFSGKDLTETDLKAKEWYDSEVASFKAMSSGDMKNKMTYDESVYHECYRNDGNPWDNPVRCQ
jgi:hypothetical protein